MTQENWRFQVVGALWPGPQPRHQASPGLGSTFLGSVGSEQHPRGKGRCPGVDSRWMPRNLAFTSAGDSAVSTGRLMCTISQAILVLLFLGGRDRSWSTTHAGQMLWKKKFLFLRQGLAKVPVLASTFRPSCFSLPSSLNYGGVSL